MTRTLARKLFDAPLPHTTDAHSVDTPSDITIEAASVPDLPTGNLKAQAVPKAQQPQPLPWPRIIMPVVMVLAMVAMVAFMVLSQATFNPMMMMFPLFMVVSMLAMLQPKGSNEEDDTRRSYLRHLVFLRDQALEHAAIQRQREHTLHPDANTLSQGLVEHREQRDPQHEHFMAVRLGVGRTPLCTPIEVEDPGNAEDLDPVCAIALRRVVRAVGTIPEMPVVLQPQAFPIIAVVGEQAPGLIRQMLLQLAYHHQPAHVSIEVDEPLRRLDQWQWLKWLAHTTADAHHGVQVVDAKDHDATSMPGLRADRTLLLCFEGSLAQAELHPMVALAEAEGLVLIAQDDRISVLTEAGMEDLGQVELASVPAAAQLARSLATSDAQAGTTQGLQPLEGLFPEVEQLRKRWVARGPQRLQVPIGVREDGASLLLDLKESAHGGMGPHGLCVGATGSGKSELLRTLVVSLAGLHDPETLNFVLVDFKGGATFLGLEKLPHTSAVITNLSEEAVLVERMHAAIAGEMHRRQELLRKAGNFANVGEYMAAREHRPDLEAMPALVIVVDEFSELLGQHPDFADLFVAVGRLGRSLHMHLLLASQRLEEGKLRGLDSHLSYRIGLKTFSSAESRQVLGVADAYELPNTPGAGLLKTADGELLRFHTDYVSGPLMVPTQPSDAPGQARRWDGWESTEVDMCEAASGASYLESLVDAAVQLASELGMQARQVWLPPLPEAIALASVAQPEGTLRAAIGIIDRPFEQRQDPLVLDFHGQQGHAAICGGPQSGKTTALRTLALSLALKHSTQQLRIYVLDLAAKDLAALKQLPHVAGVAHRDEPEKVARMIDEVLGLVDNAEARHTFLLIDGWHVLSAEYEEHLESLNRIAADGLASHVHLVLSTPRWTAMRPAVRDLIAQRIELKLGEALDSLIDRKIQERLPHRPGLGVHHSKEQMLIAHSGPQDIAHVTRHCADQPRVPALKLLPHAISVDALEHDLAVVLGVGAKDLKAVAWDFAQSPHLLCFGAQGSGKSTLLASVLQQVAAMDPQQARVVLIDPRRSHLGTVPEHMLAGYAGSRQATEALMAETLITLRGRLPGAELSAEQLRARNWWEGPELFVCIDDADLCDPASLAPLLEVLPHARDIGLHVVCIRKMGGAMRALFQPLLAELKDQHPLVLLLSGERDDGPLFGVRPSAQIPGRAVWVERGSQQGMLQVATPKETP
ncbi:type VII secretion protein EccCb [Corynebacterium pseudopelargi]|uniref:ESX-1 secretion system protein EccCa1 n=1 Tax=Corynebacterium pseudopelargi TaxID=2080757 RepID=A0A3G6IVZ2_9CORY|nr:type VII secretion protein EccCb [Corynebacterium pseudopelargi]AZA09949.1 ESX-1 secretion system protein EccCa1 [Corynebacterium pseudopelargi]